MDLGDAGGDTDRVQCQCMTLGTLFLCRAADADVELWAGSERDCERCESWGIHSIIVRYEDVGDGCHDLKLVGLVR